MKKKVFCFYAYKDGKLYYADFYHHAVEVYSEMRIWKRWGYDTKVRYL